MKIVFMGTPDFSVPVLKALATEHEVVCVYTQPAREAGRGQKVVPTPVNVCADELQIPVRTPKSLRNAEEQENFRALNADVAVVAAYGLILPSAVLEAYPKGCINVHASLLPRWRGAAPIQRAIEAGDDKSGITIMQMDAGLDTGNMLLKGEVEITPEMTGGALHDALSALGAELIVNVLRDLENITPQKQDDALACYAKKIEKAEAKLDFNLSAQELEQKIRAFNPYPAAYFEHNGERFKIFEAEAVADNSGAEPGTILDSEGNLLIACGEGILIVDKIQRQGKKVMTVEELLRGFSFK